MWRESGSYNPVRSWPLPAGRHNGADEQREALFEEVEPQKCAPRLARSPQASPESSRGWYTDPSCGDSLPCGSLESGVTLGPVPQKLHDVLVHTTSIKFDNQHVNRDVIAVTRGHQLFFSILT